MFFFIGTWHWFNQNNFIINVFYQVVQKDERGTEHERCTTAVFVFKEEKDPLQPPHDAGIVLEGATILNELPSMAHVCNISCYLASSMR